MADYLLGGVPPDPPPVVRMFYGGHSHATLKLAGAPPTPMISKVRTRSPGKVYYHRAWDQGSNRWVSWTSSAPNLNPNLSSTSPAATGPLVGIKVESITPK